jgi:hypothetical protein
MVSPTPLNSILLFLPILFVSILADPINVESACNGNGSDLFSFKADKMMAKLGPSGLNDAELTKVTSSSVNCMNDSISNSVKMSATLSFDTTLQNLTLRMEAHFVIKLPTSAKKGGWRCNSLILHYDLHNGGHGFYQKLTAEQLTKLNWSTRAGHRRGRQCGHVEIPLAEGVSIENMRLMPFADKEHPPTDKGRKMGCFMAPFGFNGSGNSEFRLREVQKVSKETVVRGK